MIYKALLPPDPASRRKNILPLLSVCQRPVAVRWQWPDRARTQWPALPQKAHCGFWHF